MVGRDRWRCWLGRLWGDSVKQSLCITSIYIFIYLGVLCRQTEGGTDEVEMFAEGEGKRAVERVRGAPDLIIGFGVLDDPGGLSG